MLTAGLLQRLMAFVANIFHNTIVADVDDILRLFLFQLIITPIEIFMHEHI